MPFADILEKIPTMAKVLFVIGGAFSFGFGANSLLSSYAVLPDQVRDNQVLSANNRRDIDSLRAVVGKLGPVVESGKLAVERLNGEIGSLRVEIRYANCLELKQRDPTVSLSRCIQQEDLPSN